MMQQPSDSEIEELALQLKSQEEVSKRLDWLNRSPRVEQSELSKRLSQVGPHGECAIKQLIALGQIPESVTVATDEQIADLAVQLEEVDAFYREMGGLVGYQMQVRRLLQKKDESAKAHFYSPSFIDISKRTEEVDAAIDQGIIGLSQMCEMYPLGGAADRLHLVDEESGCDLPAAKLRFGRKTLLERLLCDLESRERLHYQRTGQRVFTPVAIMTSHEKNNQAHVQEILESNHWFGRPKERFFLFVQPLVPTVDGIGNWIWAKAHQLSMKPGGHGAIWKLALDHGVFDWFRSFGAKYALIRQINNPLAGLDYGLLAFSGLGISRKMSFGFASCPRVCQAAEGVNVVVERKVESDYHYHLSNIEYCDFEKYGIQDTPMQEGEPFSRFTSNTNILFANLDDLQQVIERCPFPGLLMNLKKDSAGRMSGRLESTMQNIADMFVEKTAKPLSEKKLNQTFITYNQRLKTISTAKKAYVAGGSFNETPEKCFYDLMKAARDLLQSECNVVLPKEISLEEMLKTGPSFVFLFHPCLGPLFSTIGKKIQKGSISEGSELILDLAEVKLSELCLDGSLQVSAKMDRVTNDSECVLKQCSISNRGVDWEHSRPYWKGDYVHFESCKIELGAGSKFIAEGVHFLGEQSFVVPDGKVMQVTQEKEKLHIHLEGA